MQVRAQSGLKLKDLNKALKSHSLALCNLGSISSQTLGGILGTSVHGTGITHSLLSTQIIKMVFYDALSNRHEVSKDDKDLDLFNALLCNLGCLGIVTEVTIQAVKEFNLKVEQRAMGLNDILKDLNKFIYNNEYFRFWWFPNVLNKEPGSDLDSIIWKADKSDLKVSLDIISTCIICL